MMAAAIGWAVLATPGAQGDLAAACRLDAPAPSSAGITVADTDVVEGSYRALRAGGENGAYLMIYFDRASETPARANAPCLAAQLGVLQRELGDHRTGIEWSSAVFTSDRDHIPPRVQGAVSRWIIHTRADSATDAHVRSMVVRTLPHEQVHAYQGHAGARLPRWFSEGHATWVGLRVTAMIDPAAAQIERAKHAQWLSDGTGPLRLAEWGGVRPKREAIMRQVSAEDRARMIADPTYAPSGTFAFTMDDLIGDESNMLARYGAAYRVFEELEARHGAERVRAFAAEASAGSGTVSAATMAALTEKHFGERLDVLLAEPPAE